MKRKKLITLIATVAVLAAAAIIFFIADSGRYNKAVYIYMCGSTLEYNNGAGTEGLNEILSADIPKDGVVVIQTGGAKKWRGFDIPEDKICRYIIKDGKLVLKQELENANMGDGSTLSGFLAFCAGKYPAQNTSLIFWDHGQGSTGSVCFDQNYDMDGLNVNEIAAAMKENDSHFDMIGFDACLMANYDVINALSPYADYMIASEEIEPAGGWDYEKTINIIMENDDMKEAGVLICDSYMEKCKSSEKESTATMSLIDLSNVESLRSSFEDFALFLNQKAEKAYGNFEILNATSYASKFGGNSRLEGYSNLIDICGFAEELMEEDASAKKLCDAVKSAVVYSVMGDKRKNAAGISIYYPLIYDAKMTAEYLNICSSKNYKKYIEDIYTSEKKDTISFEDSGSVLEDGSFGIRLTAESKKYIKSVEYRLIEFENADDESYRMNISTLGYDNDMYGDWETLEFHSNFRGVWLSLNGAPLYAAIIEDTKDQIIFSAPVIVNDGFVSNLRFSYTFDESAEDGGYYSIIGIWDGLDSSGLPSKSVTRLEEGDKVTVLYNNMAQEDYEAALTQGQTVTIGSDGGVISETALKQPYYQYVFVVTDIYGNKYYSDTAVFEMLYTADELEKNPLEDGEYAARVYAVSGDVDATAPYITANE